MGELPGSSAWKTSNLVPCSCSSFLVGVTMPVERMRMRPWLEEQINSNRIPGLKWLNKVRGVHACTCVCVLKRDFIAVPEVWIGKSAHSWFSKEWHGEEGQSWMLPAEPVPPASPARSEAPCFGLVDLWLLWKHFSTLCCWSEHFWRLH